MATSKLLAKILNIGMFISVSELSVIVVELGSNNRNSKLFNSSSSASLIGHHLQIRPQQRFEIKWPVSSPFKLNLGQIIRTYIIFSIC